MPDHALVLAWLVLSYALAGTLPLALLLVIVRSRGARRVLVALSAVVFALLHLENFLYYRHTLPAVAVAAGWAVFSGIVLAAAAVVAGRRTIAIAAAVGWAWLCPLALSSHYSTPPGPAKPPPLSAPASRILFMGLDAADPDVLFPLAESGALPNIARLMGAGAYGRMRSMTPCESQSLWTTIATGRLPRDHGITGFVAFRLPGMTGEIRRFPRRLALGRLEHAGLLRMRTQAGHERRAAAVWDILSDAGLDVGIVNWWASHPAPPVRGVFVSNFHFYRQRGQSASGGEVYPPELFPELEPFVRYGADVSDDELQALLGCSVREARGHFPLDLLKERCLSSDLTYFPMATMLFGRQKPAFFALYLNGLDPIEHYFWAHRAAGGDDPPTRCFRDVVDNYYRYYDRLVGEMVSLAGDSTTVVLLSDHGMSRVGLAKRLYESVVMGNPLVTGMHEDAPDGIIVMAGNGIAPAGELRPTGLVDVAPTLLALLGLPIAGDMPGEPLLEALDNDFLTAHPISHIDSYGGAPPLEAPAQTGSLEQLRALGYLP
jgi:predicted AlkP superfamily phosphohydrolase/phosphomutase